MLLRHWLSLPGIMEERELWSTEERGGMAGAGQGTCALRKAGSGKESPLFVTAGPRREDGDLSGWDGEKGGPGMGSG